MVSAQQINDPLVLVVDDDSRLRRLLQKFLKENGFIVFAAADSQEADALISWFDFDLMVVDIMMPRENGIDFTKRLRAQGSDVPVLMLTAMGAADNRITGLEAGADDYLSKPFDPRELVLRLNGILRRVMSAPPEKQRVAIRFGKMSYDLDENELYENGEKVKLPASEAVLLRLLAERAGQGISREELAAKTGNETNLRTVDVQITRLRRKIEPDLSRPKYVQTVRGKGYSLIPD